MPSSTEKQRRFMAACTNPDARKQLKSCPPVKVAEEFHAADKKLLKQVDANPSQAQIEAGNYRKAHIRFQGMDITIENPRGSVRSGVSPEGKPWHTEMKDHYGYLKRTIGADGDHVDVFVGPDEAAENVYIVDQVDAAGRFDEHKCMLGFNSLPAAKEAYRRNYERGWRVGPITTMTVPDFKDWLQSGQTEEPLVKAIIQVNGGAVSRHPCPDHEGNPVMIAAPDYPTGCDSWDNPKAVAVFVPDGDAPASINGLPLHSWVDCPQGLGQWIEYAALFDIEEPAIDGENVRAVVIVQEPDGRIWLSKPTNSFGGYQYTFPGGRVEFGVSPRLTALKECYEHTGLQVEITGFAGDFSCPDFIQRVYIGRRISGLPTDMGWETQAVALCPLESAGVLINMPVDQWVLARV